MKTTLVINEDNSHFFGTRRPEEMTLAGLHAFVDQYAGSAVTHLFLNPNGMCANFRSRTRDAIWDPVDGKEPGPERIWPQNARRLFIAGLDPYTVWIDRCREKGISPWLSMRMNDIHCVDDPGSYMHSSMWRSSPGLWRVPNGPGDPWINRALNYVHAEVREHQMAFVRELLERYAPDGFELDWMRFGYHLTPGRECDEAGILTDFVREVRSLTNEWSRKRGHAIPLAVRVPAHPDAAIGLGMDAVQWARDELVDLIVPCPFWTSSDFDIPVELWRERLGPAVRRTAILPGFEYNVRPWPGGEAVENDLASLRGFAASVYYRGADGLYLFNWMDSETRPVPADEYARLLKEGISKDVVANASRRHPVCYRDTVPAGFPDDIQLPADARAGAKFRIHAGAKLDAGNAWAIVGLARRDGVAGARLEALLNGRSSGAAEDMDDCREFGGGTVRAIRFPCRLEDIRDGFNELHVRQVGGEAAQQIVWAELRLDPGLE